LHNKFIPDRLDSKEAAAFLHHMLAVLICLSLKGRHLPRNRFDALSAMAETLIIEQPRQRALGSLPESLN
jgi:hypothetical protein